MRSVLQRQRSLLEGRVHAEEQRDPQRGVAAAGIGPGQAQHLPEEERIHPAQEEQDGVVGPEMGSHQGSLAGEDPGGDGAHPGDEFDHSAQPAERVHVDKRPVVRVQPQPGDGEAVAEQAGPQEGQRSGEIAAKNTGHAKQSMGQ